MEKILKLENIGFRYGDKPVLRQINYSFEPGKIYGIVGKSGSGKTTLLSVMSGLAEPSEGRILCRGEDLTARDKYIYRSRDIGVIFQNFNLLTKLTAAENVELSLELSLRSAGQKADPKELYFRAYGCLREVGLGQEEADRRVLKLSGGQQQRVAIARALSYNPECILADEPTGNLDEHTQKEIMEIFRRLEDSGKCVIIVTHSSYVAGCADRCIELQQINHLQ
ncbi:ABC transporter ATP-binding protein [Eubacterium pyruvativorans]|uniref:ABC transporter ATP-binding protein n=1 Tax=Eubacterium pyruvativorans TaxID=155865 RepID=UPI0015684393|nr:ABC transporter ATP-binding protein [Eubacterium pyruvativorans]